MKAEYLNQIIYCSTHDGRAFLREVAVTPTDAAVTRIETLPQGYEHAMAHMRNPREQVRRIPGALKTMSNYKGCPYCGKTTAYECDNCGALSCISSDPPPHHACPVCGSIGEPEWGNYHTVSDSGFTGDRLPDLPWNGGAEKAPRIARPEPPRRPPIAPRGGPNPFGPLEDRYLVTKDRPGLYDAPRRPPSVTMDPQVSAPPPVKGLLEASPEDRDEMRNWLMKRNGKK